jgi:hypothetical protein
MWLFALRWPSLRDRRIGKKKEAQKEDEAFHGRKSYTRPK